MELCDIFYVPTWLLLIIVVIILCYLNATKNCNYWKARGIKQAKPVPLLGSIDFSKPFHEIELERYNKLGRIHGHYVGIQAQISVGDPDLLKNILVKDFAHFVDRAGLHTGDEINDNLISFVRGETWKRIRTIITPAFTSGKLKKILSLMKDSSSTLVTNLRKVSAEKKPFDCKILFGAFAMDVICTSAFGTKIDSHNDPDNPIVTEARKLFSKDFNYKFFLLFIFPWITKFVRLPVFDRGTMQYYKRVILDIIEERKRTGKKQNDFLQLMLDASKEVPLDEICEDEEEQEKGNAKLFRKNIGNKNLSIDELVAQAVTFFIAGYDTSASTLSFTAYFLAHNPEIQEKLIQEIDELVPDAENIDYETVSKLKYLDQVISETLRICPVASRILRICTEDYKLGDTGIVIPKEMTVTIPVHGIHHDPEFYPDPETYDPERFTPEAKAKRHPFTYLPFGAGPRNCIALRFAMLEMKVCLATVFKHFRFTVDPHQGPFEYYKGQLLLQPKSISLNVEPRNDI